MKTRDFRALRAAGEFIRDMPEDHTFDEIRAVEVTYLNDDEAAALNLFSDGAYVPQTRGRFTR